MALDDYLVSEVRLDHSDGHITRREALRLLGLLGVAGSTAAMWLEADAASAASKTTTKKTTKKKTTTKKSVTTTSPVAATSSRAPATLGTPVPNPQAVSARSIRFAGPAGELGPAFAPQSRHRVAS